MNLSKDQLDKAVIPEGKVVFLGSNPSCSSPYDDPFSHCKSATKILSEWIPAIGLTRDDVYFVNVANYKTPKNRPLKKSEIKAELPRLAVQLKGHILVALGKSAQQAVALLASLNLLSADDLKKTVCMPHPSGLNRQLNDKDWVRQQIIACKEKIALCRSKP